MRFKVIWVIPATIVLGLFIILFFQGAFTVPDQFPVLDPDEMGIAAALLPSGSEQATFGSGCFWCSEAVFQQLKGVQKVVSGYSGGSVKNPTYKQVCSGTTGHAEVVQITFDTAVVSYPELLEVFWRSHDPTTQDRQGNDVGTQYRSVVFYHTDRQHQLAECYKQKIDAAEVFKSPLVTEIAPFTEFYPAEVGHQNYYAENSRQPYCRIVIRPKLDKLQKVFGEKMRAE
ncbi:MAG TPA: peptide-methionine (S)-S-oxide reductase MsrA [Gemmata sp.]|nr:peptide-methionine (S)-S-oxide reductase MsrA [Gemmata sp.]